MVLNNATLATLCDSSVVVSVCTWRCNHAELFSLLLSLCHLRTAVILFSCDFFFHVHYAGDTLYLIKIL